MTKLIAFTMLGMGFLICLMIYGIIILTFRKEKLEKNHILDPFTTDYYRNELDTIIQYKTVYHVDAKVGKLFGSTNSVTTDIPNDEILEVYDEIIADINESIPPRMYLYLNNVMGSKWMTSYINTETMSYLLNYTNLTIEGITADKFGRK